MAGVPAAGEPGSAAIVEEVGGNHPVYLLARSLVAEGKLPSSVKKKATQTFQLNGTLPYKNFKFLPDHPLVGAKNVGDVRLWHSQNSVLYIWAPEAFFFHLVPQMPCKECGQTRNVGADGWPESCRKVVALEGTYYVYSRRYRCKNCPAKGGQKDVCFIGTDPDVLKRLPAWVRNLLPIHFTHKGAIHRVLKTLIFRDIMKGKGISDTRAALNEVRHDEFYMLEESYLSAAVSCRQRLGAFGAPTPPAAFGNFEDPLGFNGAVPHPAYFGNVVVALGEGERKEYLDKQTCLRTGGKFFKFDHTFASAKRVKQNGERVIGCFATGMNEYGQPVLQFGAVSTSLDEARPHIEAYRERKQQLQQEQTQVGYVDNLDCTEKRWTELLPEVQYWREDAWHWLDRYLRSCNKDHPLLPVFACKLSMALFSLHGADEQLLRRDLLDKGMNQEEIQGLPLSYWKRRCRRIIDKPEVIAPRVDAVVQHFETLFTRGDGQPLFKGGPDGTMALHARQMALLWRGALSDPPGVEMDISVTRPGARSPRYITARGSSQLEGYHPLVHAVLSGSNIGVKLANCLLRELRYRVIIDRGVANRGDRDLVTYDHRRIESVKLLTRTLGLTDPYPEWALTPPGFVCRETFGIPEGFDFTPFVPEGEASGTAVVDCQDEPSVGEEVPLFGPVPESTRETRSPAAAEGASSCVDAVNACRAEASPTPPPPLVPVFAAPLPPATPNLPAHPSGATVEGDPPGFAAQQRESPTSVLTSSPPPLSAGTVNLDVPVRGTATSALTSSPPPLSGGTTNLDVPVRETQALRPGQPNPTPWMRPTIAPLGRTGATVSACLPFHKSVPVMGRTPTAGLGGIGAAASVCPLARGSLPTSVRPTVAHTVRTGPAVPFSANLLQRTSPTTVRSSSTAPHGPQAALPAFSVARRTPPTTVWGNITPPNHVGAAAVAHVSPLQGSPRPSVPLFAEVPRATGAATAPVFDTPRQAQVGVISSPCDSLGGRKRKRGGPATNSLAAPVTTPQERSLFFQLLEAHNPGAKEPGWSPMTVAWNSHLSNLLNASNDHNSKLLGIFPKTSFHLRSFYRDHTKQVQIQEALHFSPAAREAHAALNRQLEEGFWGRAPSVQAPLCNQFPAAPLGGSATVTPAHTISIHTPPPSLIYTHGPPQSSVEFPSRPPLQNLGTEHKGSLRGGLGKGKVCKLCGQSRLGHPRKGCPTN